MELRTALLAAYDEAMTAAEEIRSCEEPWPGDDARKRFWEALGRLTDVMEQNAEAVRRMRSGGPRVARVDYSELLDIWRQVTPLADVLMRWSDCKSEWVKVLESKPCGDEHDLALRYLADISARRAGLQEEFREGRPGVTYDRYIAAMARLQDRIHAAGKRKG